MLQQKGSYFCIILLAKDFRGGIHYQQKKDNQRSGLRIYKPAGRSDIRYYSASLVPEAEEHQAAWPDELCLPGANHSRFQHCLGALHLMDNALKTLKSKGITISQQEEEAALIAILLHDIGHGPFSHALEASLINGIEP